MCSHRHKISQQDIIAREIIFKGVLELTYTLITVSSVTYAMKAKSVLNGAGFYCEIERQEKGSRNGCGYQIRIKDDPAVVCRLLEGRGISCRERKTVER